MKGLDTNVLLRLYVRDDAGQAARAARYVSKHCSPRSACRINRATLCELVWVLERGYRYSRQDVARLLEGILIAADLAVEDADAAARAVRQFLVGFDFADIYVGETNRGAGCEVTATFDRKAAKLKIFEAV